MRTYDQKMAEKAFKCVLPRKDNKEYRSFALSFPALVHSCGLVQAVAFAEGKEDRKKYLQDLTEVLKIVEGNGLDLANMSRTAQVMEYMRLSRRALSAASWIKRYVQALDEKEQGGNADA
jgi:CRISPR-associated protein Cmr5